MDFSILLPKASKTNLQLMIATNNATKMELLIKFEKLQFE